MKHKKDKLMNEILIILLALILFFFGFMIGGEIEKAKELGWEEYKYQHFLGEN